MCPSGHTPPSAGSGGLHVSGPIWTRSVEEELQTLGRKVGELEERMVKLEAYIQAKRVQDAETARLAETAEAWGDLR